MGWRGRKSPTPIRARPLRESLSADDAVTILVSFPDPANFVLARKLGGHVVPVIDRNILRQQAGDRKIYFAQEVEIESAEWVTPAKTLVTACTPLVVFTGMPGRVGDAAGRRDHEELIRTISALDRSLLLAKTSLIAALLKRGKELSADGAKMLVLGEVARTKAKPYPEKALTEKEAKPERRRDAQPRPPSPLRIRAKRPPGKPTMTPCPWPRSRSKKSRSEGAPQKE